jgi:DNA mismatch repair protein MutS
MLSTLAKRLHGLDETKAQITAALVEEPPLKLTEGGLIKDGFDAQLDELRHGSEQARTWIAELEQSERTRSGIASLKIGFNGVFGYYFEVTRPYYAQVPESFRALQTLKDRQRYTRSDLRDKEREILRAEDAARRREYLVFDDLRKQIQAVASEVRELGACLAELDTLASLAETAVQQNYCRPVFHDQQALHIEAGRHPVVEQYHHFIPNSLSMSRQERLLVLTGPNMSGKSTFLRQNALLCLLAQIGSFVPAEAARLPIFERIYTRIGASDDIAGGRSTFMVEMNELAYILHHAGQQSLVLLDEIGRGTSTFDGLALAWSATEHLHHCSQAFTLFATHYFELTQLASDLPAARNFHVAAREEADGLVFYHQVLEGPASKSYGLEVARLAGVPAEVLTRAEKILSHLEAHRANAAQEVIELLLTQDIDQLSPLKALQLVHQLQALARGLGDR